jgi:hypothetical protein
VLAVFCVSALALTKAEALEPKLLWKKEFKGYIKVEFAKDSGDVIVHSWKPWITVMNINGDITFEWGPRIDRGTYSPDISDNGSFFIFSSQWRKSFKSRMKKEDKDERIHYIQQTGKELWSKKYSHVGVVEYDYTGAYVSYLSPDGKHIAIVGIFDPDGEGDNIELWDSTGKRLWVHEAEGVEGFMFSPDSKYLIADLGGGGIKILDQSGNIIYKDEFSLPTGLPGTSVSRNADYIGTSGFHRTAVIDRQGNIVLDNGKGEGKLAFVNRGGTRGVLWDENGIKVYNLPSKELVRSYKIGLVLDGLHTDKIDMSEDGRYMVLSGKKLHSESQNNLFVIDLVEEKMWETYLQGFDYIGIKMMGNGKHFLVKTDYMEIKKGEIRFYQVY